MAIKNVRPSSLDFGDAFDDEPTVDTKTRDSGGFGMGILSLLGTAGSLLFGWLGMEKEEEQAEDIFGKQMKIRGEDIAREEKWAKKKFRFEKQQAAKKWKWMEEGRNVERGTGMVNQFLGMLGSEPQLQQQLQQTWRTK